MIKIEFELDPTSETSIHSQLSDQLICHLKAFGFSVSDIITNTGESICNDGEDKETADFPLTEEVEVEPEEKPKRKRRTKAEIQAATATVTVTEEPEPWGETLDPFDALDESRETVDKEPTLTHDDLRKVVGKYAQVYGLPNAQKAIPEILGCAVADVKADDICFAIEKIEAAIEKAKAPREFTKDDILDAIKAYARKYDGQDDDLQAAEHTRKDIAAVLEKLFKDPRLSKIPATPEAYGEAVREIYSAVKTNTFKREVKQ